MWVTVRLKLAEDNGHHEVVSYLKSKGGSYDIRIRRGIFSTTDNSTAESHENTAGLAVDQTLATQADAENLESLENMGSNIETDKIHNHIFAMEKQYVTMKKQYVTSGAGKATPWIPQLVRSITQGMYEGIYSLISAKPAISTTTKESIQNVDVNGAIMLLDVLIRKVTGQKYVSTTEQSVSLLEAQVSALNITKKFEKVISKSCNMPAAELVDLAEMQSRIYQDIRYGNGSRVPDILLLYATSIIEVDPQTCLNNVTVKNLLCAEYKI